MTKYPLRTRAIVVVGLVVGTWLILASAAALGAQLASADVVHLPADGGVTFTQSGYVCGAEDDASWNWALCGNGKRGVVTLHGNPRVVDACTFQRYMRQHVIAYRVRVQGHTYTTLERMRGDATAMRVECGR